MRNGLAGSDAASNDVLQRFVKVSKKHTNNPPGWTNLSKGPRSDHAVKRQFYYSAVNPISQYMKSGTEQQGLMAALAETRKELEDLTQSLKLYMQAENTIQK